MDMRDDARRIIAAGIAAASARAAVRRALRLEGDTLTVGGEETIDLSRIGRVMVIGAGKAAAAMATGALDVLGDRVAGGTITTKGGHGAAIDRIEVWEAAHPVPDTRGLAGAAAALEAARGAGERDLVLCLLSGGASALWPAPPPGVSLSDLKTTTDRLLRAGVPIGGINAVRKHLSRISGGRLARAAFPARVVTLAVSDVVGGPLDVIASGPTVPDPTTFEDALEVLRHAEVTAPPSVMRHLRAGAAGDVAETPKPGDPAFARASAHVVATGRDALEGAAREAERLGYAATVVADDLEGEAREAANAVATLARTTRAGLAPGARPAALLLGGETTVTVRGRGRGGRNQELALALACRFEAETGMVAASVGTDGTDGPTDAAGAIIDGGTTARGLDAGAGDARGALDRNDAYPFLRAAGDLLFTGPTGTHVNDVVLLLVEPPAAS
jgi:glycerate 2-kinase